MRNRLKNALSLMDCQTTESLISQFLPHCFSRSSLSALAIVVLSPRDNRLLSYSVDYAQPQITTGLLDKSVTGQLSRGKHPENIYPRAAGEYRYPRISVLRSRG